MAHPDTTNTANPSRPACPTPTSCASCGHLIIRSRKSTTSLCLNCFSNTLITSATGPTTMEIDPSFPEETMDTSSSSCTCSSSTSNHGAMDIDESTGSDQNIEMVLDFGNANSNANITSKKRKRNRISSYHQNSEISASRPVKKMRLTYEQPQNPAFSR